jgi:hypothetical protein
MQLVFEPPPVYFMHVPKTAGTTVQRWLRRYYRDDQTIVFQRTKPEILAAVERQETRLIYSKHLGWDAYQLIRRRDLEVISVLRDPIERALSGFFHQQRYMAKHGRADAQGDRFAHYSIAAGTIDDHINAAPVQELLYNGQVLCLAGVRTARSLLDGEYQPASAPLQTAMRWLEQMSFVGLTERYQESAAVIADRLGVPLRGSTDRKYKNPQRALRESYRDRLKPSTLAAIEELNRDDQELYRCAVELFDQHYARYCARPQRTYSIAAYGRRVMHALKHRRHRL